ncbi:hypothetical protein Ait01nite_035980 [Actinoplanes italicus]|uniref:Uncharacterized protein n=1 Tax=Actinoplanes italicus TaxID=113567 RepID=A0A2T0K8N3_9ACTN|nr:hypothetical protein [Actinoplanes italicus]PRX19432.1 hypothetical protein CLV67_110184 [Actinoplanes italicus]GIE30553.1 hypothetical protein Ait01nite_035980 [Actinoplanes italicus]
MTDWDHGLHEGPPGFDRPGDNRTDDELRELLFDAVPELSESDRLALFDRTFDPATPDPLFDVIADGDLGGADLFDAGDVSYPWVEPDPHVEPVVEPEPDPEPWTDHVEPFAWEDL